MSGSEGGPNLDAYISRRRRRRMAGVLVVLLVAALPHRPPGFKPCLRYRGVSPKSGGNRHLEPV